MDIQAAKKAYRLQTICLESQYHMAQVYQRVTAENSAVEQVTISKARLFNG